MLDDEITSNSLHFQGNSIFLSDQFLMENRDIVMLIISLCIIITGLIYIIPIFLLVLSERDFTSKHRKKVIYGREKHRN